MTEPCGTYSAGKSIMEGVPYVPRIGDIGWVGTGRRQGIFFVSLKGSHHETDCNIKPCAMQ